MSTRTLCDSCGCEINEANPSAAGDYDINGVVNALTVIRSHDHDICRKCLVKYIDPPAPPP